MSCREGARCDLGDPGWGDPWFPHLSLVASRTLQVAHGDFVFCVCCCLILWACQHDAQVVICMRRDDYKLSTLASTDLFHP